MLAMNSETLPLTLGVLIPGMGVAAVLYGITCAQTFCYFQANGNKDPILIKGLTIMLWLLNTIDIAIIIHILYFYLISAVVNPALQSQIVGTLPASSVIVGLVAFLVYSYYIWRLWLLSRNAILCIILTLFATATLGSSLAFTVRGYVVKMTLQQFYGASNMRSVLVASSCATATDFFAALSLSWYLLKSRTGIKESVSIVNILIAYTINTGLLASICAFCALLMTILLPNTNLALFFSFMVPPLQINGYLGSLNGRNFFRRWGEAHAHSNSEAMTMSSLRIVSHLSPKPPQPRTLEVGDFDLEDVSTDPGPHRLSSVIHGDTKGRFVSDSGISI